MNPVVCIAGPTASGKSAWAVSLAKKYDGEIINADAMQVYKDLRILSARPDKKEMAGVPHHLFGHVDGKCRYSVGKWIRDAEPVILNCLARGKLPILTGGTGLYFRALVQGLAEIPDPGPTAMAYAQDLLDAGIDRLRKEAETIDPIATGRVLGNDPQRLLRIVSVAKGTERPLSTWQKSTKPIIPKPHWIGAVLMPDRAELYDKINSRYEKMVMNGGLEEARFLISRKIDPGLPVMKAIGVGPLIDHLEGKKSLENAVEEAKRDTRRFAKRQYTWFRGHSKGWISVTSDAHKVEFEEKISQLLR